MLWCLGAGAFFRRLRRLQVSSEVAGPLDDPVVVRQALSLEAAQRGFDIACVEDLCEGRGVVRGL